MTLVPKRIVITLGILLVVFLAPIIWSAFGAHGYFDGGRCVCGHRIYIYLKNNAYCEYSPGHGRPGHPVFSLRPADGGWEALAIGPPPDAAYESLVKSGEVVARARLRGGNLYVSWNGGTNWTRHARIYNVWSVWMARLLSADPVAQPINCVSNLKQIGIAFLVWAADHGDQYPFNVSTNAGGTMEFCSMGKDGFDRNAVLHLKAMANSEGMTSPKILVCPQDRSKKAATNWAGLQAENITCRFRSGTNVAETSGNEVLAICPVDGNTLYCDGHVEKGQARVH